MGFLEKLFGNAFNHEGKYVGKQIWWVDDLSILYRDNKYALDYTRYDKWKTTKYLYDDVDILNHYQVRIAQMQPDGSFRYGVACSGGFHFHIINCDYIKVTFLDGDNAVLAIDEDSEEYAICYDGDICNIEEYRKSVQKKMRKKLHVNESEEEE